MDQIVKEIEKLILFSDFENIKDLLKNYDIKTQGRIILTVACNTYNITAYGFIVSQLINYEVAYWHVVATEIFLVPLCHLEGADSLGLYHIRRAIALEPENVEWQQLLLSFHNSPEPIVSKEEAILVAKKLLILDPTNANALRLLEEYRIKTNT